ncbi:pilus assembly protein TadG-related protein [Methylobacterium oxalidis]|uniref:pilus assembly protein TadG-related protein n=1 Tax=Methylobacterium oxalidis TaxID=944322 RepID=UPI0033161E1E
MRRLVRDERGSITVVFALTAPVLFGMGAVAIDLSVLRYNNMRLQMAADAGALAAVYHLANATKAVQTGVTIANLNAPANAGQVTFSSDVELGIYDAASRTFRAASSGTSINAVRVSAHRNEAHQNRITGFFSRFVGGPSAFSLSAQAIATLTTTSDGPACVYALDEKNPDTLTIAGSTSVSLGCGARAKSSSPTAISSQGNAARMSATSVCQARTPAQNPRGFNPSVSTCGLPTADPFASLAEPTPTNCKAGGTLTGTLTPGCYIGSVTFRGDVTLAAGTYYFQGVDLKINSNANISGSGVTLFLDASSSLDITGNPAIKLSAPTNGSLSGLAIFQSRAAAGASLTISGNSDVAINGAIYAPATSMTFTGSGTTTNPARYGSVIAAQVHFSGNSGVSFGSFDTSGGTTVTSSRASLVN